MVNDMKYLHHSPNWDDRDSWTRAIPVTSPPISYLPDSKTITAEAEQINKVSTNTPKAWIKPCFTGWDVVAQAAAFGTEPSPASLENRPRLIPVMITAAKPPATADWGAKASWKIK